MIQTWTTYRDNKGRQWVITSQCYSEITSKEVTGYNLYLVGSNQEFKNLSKVDLEKYIEQKLFTLITN